MEEVEFLNPKPKTHQTARLAIANADEWAGKSK
jgi:hypothetical protein